jgi:hypothetical protein
MLASSAAWIVAMLFVAVGRTVQIGHAHAAEADGGNSRALLAQLTCIHCVQSRSRLITFRMTANRSA